MTRLTGGLLRLNTDTQGLKTGQGTSSLHWGWLDVASHRTNAANDAGDYTLDGAGHLVLTSLGHAV